MPGGPGAMTCRALFPGAAIALPPILALALGLIQLSRLGCLSGFTQYDEGR